MWSLPATISPVIGVWTVFASVLLTQLGIPVPAAPLLILAGTTAALGQASFLQMLLAAVLAAMIADNLWFFAGRWFGRRLLNKVVRFSLSLDSTVRIARTTFERFGAPLLAIAKFVPGLGLVSPPLLGTTTVGMREFWLWDAVGAILWSGFYLLAGAAFQSQIALAMVFVRGHGVTVIETAVVLSAIFLLFRWGRRLWFRRWLAQVRITPVQLDALIRSEGPPVIFDARPADVRRSEAYRIPGAIALDLNSPARIDPAYGERPIVIYCVCPNEATAKRIIAQLRRKGIHRVQALKGGLDAWEKQGYMVEPIA